MAVMILDNFRLLFGCLLLVLVVGDDDELSAELVGVLNLLTERASTTENHHEETLVLVEVIQFHFGEVVRPAVWFTALTISFHGCDDLADP